MSPDWQNQTDEICFFVDLFRFNQTGETLLEDEYIRLPNGPVLDVGFSYTDNSNAYLNVTWEQVDPERCLYQYTPRKKSDMSLFSEDDIKLFDVVIETLKKHNTEHISDLTHKFSLWNDAKNGEIITKEKLRLDDYEYDELESFFYYLHAVKSAKEPGELSESASEDTVPDELLSLQFETMDGQINEESYS
ncbi:MAG: Panacea domain-containing protein [Euryarchaeota archaeon]|nr:Panacea domain-containing protein [Euryarchaeota archaeon]